MENKESSLTSLVSAFSRAYHVNEDHPIIFNDTLAQCLLTNDEYSSISHNMVQGIQFFSPEMAEKLKGNDSAILKWVNQIQLSPTPLARAAYAEQVVTSEIKLGAEQYVILGAGLDTFAWRHPNPDIAIFEVDHPSTQQFKLQRLQQANLGHPDNLTFVAMDFTKELSLKKLRASGFDPNKKTVFTLLGVTYYLTKDLLQQLLGTLFKDLPKGSSVIFDVADERLFTEPGIYNRVQNIIQMAAASGEPMKFSTTLPELELLLASEQLFVFEHLAPQDIQNQYFSDREDDLQAFETIHYIHAVKN